MRTLELSETEMVAGGVLPAALVPLIKAAVPYVTTFATAAVGIATAKYAATVVSNAIDKAAETCEEGGQATVKSPAVDMSCSGKTSSGSNQSKAAPASDPGAGMLKIMLPEYLGGR